MSLASKILHKRSSVSTTVPSLTALELGELAINTADGTVFTKTNGGEIVSFLDSSKNPYVFDFTLSATNTQYGFNEVFGTFAGVLNGFSNNVSGSSSSIVNGENNTIESNFSLIGNGSNNTITLTADNGAIIGGSNNNLAHCNSFIVGSDITSHLENFTYTNNLSVVGNVYSEGDLYISGTVELGDSEATTSLYVTDNLVGINTESPSEALTVVGNISASGSLKFGSTTSAPNDTVTPVAWIDVYVGSVLYKLPLHQ